MIKRDVKNKLDIVIDNKTEKRILNFNYNKYENMRDINSELMKRVSFELYTLLYK